MLTFPITDISSGFDGRIRLLNDLCPIIRDDAVARESLRNYSVSVQRAKSLLPPLLFDCQTSHSTVSFQSRVHTTNHNPLSDRKQCCITGKTLKIDVCIKFYNFIYFMILYKLFYLNLYKNLIYNFQFNLVRNIYIYIYIFLYTNENK